MTTTSTFFFLFGAFVLWGGFAVTLGIALKNQNK